MPAADLIIVDECHHAPANTYSKIINHYPEAKVLGLTATPCRGDGRGLGGHFSKIVEAPQIAELIVEGHLVRSRVYAPSGPTLRASISPRRLRRGRTGRRMDTPKLVGDLVSHWIKFGERRRTIVFAVNVAHSLHICGEFRSCNIRAEHLDGATPLDEREAILGRLASGETEVMQLHGTDRGLGLPRGWVLRVGKADQEDGPIPPDDRSGIAAGGRQGRCIVLDHSGAVYRHGLPEDLIQWTLNRIKSPPHPSTRSVTSDPRPR